MRLAFVLLLFVGCFYSCFAGETECEDDIEAFNRPDNEIVATKMLEQAQQYHAMGTQTTRDAAILLCKEIVRCYPETASAEEAANLLQKMEKIVPKQKREFFRGPFKHPSNPNPFLFPKDPEPEWIRPKPEKPEGEANGESAETPNQSNPLKSPFSPEARPREREEQERRWRNMHRFRRSPFNENDPFWTPKHPEYLITA